MWAYREDLLPSKAMKGNVYGVLFPLYSNEGASGVWQTERGRRRLCSMLMTHIVLAATVVNNVIIW